MCRRRIPVHGLCGHAKACAHLQAPSSMLQGSSCNRLSQITSLHGLVQFRRLHRGLVQFARLLEGIVHVAGGHVEGGTVRATSRRRLWRPRPRRLWRPRSRRLRRRHARCPPDLGGLLQPALLLQPPALGLRPPALGLLALALGLAGLVLVHPDVLVGEVRAARLGAQQLEDRPRVVLQAELLAHGHKLLLVHQDGVVELEGLLPALLRGHVLLLEEALEGGDGAPGGRVQLLECDLAPLLQVELEPDPLRGLDAQFAAGVREVHERDAAVAVDVQDVPPAGVDAAVLFLQ
mmetsp:Transcript_85614/g.277295  ORF Transcript_85614/g.277295 Transcript_85614/m.277295 type:complete len:291 (-) Transcript_85614:841-1713(-)